MNKLLVGFAEVDFTPGSLPIVGNFRTDYFSRGIHDPLFSHALVFSNGIKKIALLSVDVCLLLRENVAMMRDYITSQCDIEGNNILIAATHTHGGPLTFPRPKMPVADAKVMDVFLVKAASAVVLAVENLQEGALRVGYSVEERISFNRRIACTDGTTHPNWEEFPPGFTTGPRGPIDPQVITLLAEQGGSAGAALINFGLHPAVLAGDNWLYTADYPGYLSEAMRKTFGSGFMTAFFNGCCGNINHIDYQDPLQGRGFKMSQRIGYMLAASAVEGTCSAVDLEGTEIAVSRKMVALQRIRISEQQRKWSEEILKKAKKKPSPAQVDGLPDEYYALLYLDLYKVQEEDDWVEVTVLRVGNLAIVGVPGEAFCELGMQIKKASPAKHTVVIELANDCIGYIPTAEAFKEGGYETSTGVARYEKGAGEKIVASVLGQLDELF